MKLLNKFVTAFNLLFHGKYDTSTEEGRHKDRERKIALTAITAAIAKIIATAIPLITVKFSLGYLGDEIYGLWATVTSFFSLFTFADLGLGNGLQTELSRATGKDDPQLCKKLISSAYFMLTLVASAILLVFIVIYPFTNWGALMNAQTERSIALAGGVVFAIVCSKILNIPLALVQRTQISFQEGYKSNLWQCAGSVLSLISVIVISQFNLGSLTLIWASSMIVVVVSLLNMVVFFGFQKKEYRPRFKLVDKGLARQLLTTGIAFFFLSILTSVSLSLDSFIVAKTTALAEATPYSIAYKIAHLIGIISAMLSTPMWAANGEALARGDYAWVRRRTKSMAQLSAVLSIGASLFLIVLSKPVLGWLKEGMEIPIMTLVGMCLLQVAISIINPYFMVLNAGKKIKEQICSFAIYTVISIPLKYVLALHFGSVAIAWVGALCYIVIIVPYTYYCSKKVLDN